MEQVNTNNNKKKEYVEVYGFLSIVKINECSYKTGIDAAKSAF